MVAMRALLVCCSIAVIFTDMIDHYDEETGSLDPANIRFEPLTVQVTMIRFYSITKSMVRSQDTMFTPDISASQSHAPLLTKVLIRVLPYL